MIEKFKIVDLNGYGSTADAISYIRLKENNKTYAFYTLNEISDSGLPIMYIAEANDAPGVSMPIDNEAYDIIRKSMVNITKGEEAPSFEYLSADGKTFHVGLQKKMIIKLDKINLLKEDYFKKIGVNSTLSTEPIIENQPEVTETPVNNTPLEVNNANVEQNLQSPVNTPSEVIAPIEPNPSDIQVNNTTTPSDEIALDSSLTSTPIEPVADLNPAAPIDPAVHLEPTNDTVSATTDIITPVNEDSIAPVDAPVALEPTMDAPVMDEVNFNELPSVDELIGTDEEKINEQEETSNITIDSIIESMQKTLELLNKFKSQTMIASVSTPVPPAKLIFDSMEKEENAINNPSMEPVTPAPVETSTPSNDSFDNVIQFTPIAPVSNEANTPVDAPAINIDALDAIDNITEPVAQNSVPTNDVNIPLNNIQKINDDGSLITPNTISTQQSETPIQMVM